MIDTIYRHGDDALQNQFDISFGPLPVLIDADSIRVRATACSIPEYVVQTYEVPYKTQKFEKPSGEIEHSKECTMTIRCDKSWAVYQMLRNWITLIHDPDTGIISEDVGAASGISTIRTDITVTPVDSAGLSTMPGWTLIAAFISTLGEISFEYDGGDPISFDATFKYLKPGIPIA